MPWLAHLRLLIVINLFSFESTLHRSSVASTSDDHAVEEVTTCSSITVEGNDQDAKECVDDSLNRISNGDLAPETVDSCTDDNPQCSYWATLKPSECTTNAQYMLVHCKKACRVCDGGRLK